MHADTPDMFEPPAPREIGYQRAQDAANNADRVVGSWTENAERFAREFIAGALAPFVSSDIIGFASRRGLPEPPDKRAWGAVMHGLAKRREIIPTGKFVNYPERSRHGAPAQQWRAP